MHDCLVSLKRFEGSKKRLETQRAAHCGSAFICEHAGINLCFLKLRNEIA